MGLVKEPYTARKFRDDSSVSHLITASRGKKLYFLCSVKDDKKNYSIALKNKNDKIVFEAEIPEYEMLELAKSINAAHDIFNL